MSSDAGGYSCLRHPSLGAAAIFVFRSRIKAIEVGRTARGNAKHLTNKEIAETLGVSERQVKYDLAPDDKSGQMSPFAQI